MISTGVVLRLFTRECAGKRYGGIDQTLTDGLVDKGFGRGADITAHAAAAHDDRDYARNGQRPGLVVGADAEHKATAAGATKQIAME